VAGERRPDVAVALAATRAEVRGDVHRGRGRGAGDLDDLGDRVAAAQLQPPDAAPEIGKARCQVGTPRLACRVAQRGVEHKERDDVSVPHRTRGDRGSDGRQQGGVVGQSQVAPEPHHARHLTAPPSSSHDHVTIVIPGPHPSSSQGHVAIVISGTL
jgi:hypothetical protein